VKNYEDIKKYCYFAILGWDEKNLPIENNHGVDDDRMAHEAPELTYPIKLALQNTRKSIIKASYYDEKIFTNHINVFIVKNHEAVISFRGTIGVSAWIQNFVAFKSNLAQKFHLGKEEVENIPEFMLRSAYSKELLKFSTEDMPLPVKMFNNTKLTKGFDKKVRPNEIGNEILNKFHKIQDKIYIHAGFTTMYNEIKELIDKTVKKLLRNNYIKKITFCGHSLGGSLAKLAFINSVLGYVEHFSKFYCYSYGCPNVGDSTLEDFLAKEINRDGRCYIVNFKDDIVSYVPPETVGYSRQKNNVITIEMKHDPFKQYTLGHWPFRYVYWFATRK
jgi:predicted lipase